MDNAATITWINCTDGCILMNGNGPMNVMDTAAQVLPMSEKKTGGISVLSQNCNEVKSVQYDAI